MAAKLRANARLIIVTSPGVKFLHRAKNVAAPDGYGFFSPPSCRRQIEASAPWLGIE